MARSAVASLVALLIVAACGGAGEDVARPDPTVGVDGGGGWIDGEPDFSPGGDGAVASGDVPTAAGDTDATIAADGPAPPAADDTPLRAGSVDDNADYTGFVEYLGRIEGLGVTTRPFDASGRIMVTATRADGTPASGARVTVQTTDGATVATLRTTADGTARFFPALHGDVVDEYRFAVGGDPTSAAPGGQVELVTDVPARTAPVALDVLFLLDATGSMGDEIDRLKTTIDTVADQVAALGGQPDVRFAMTLYRDVEDTFVSTTYDFTGDVDEFQTALAEVQAAGGGDYPEALDEGLAEALGAPSWRDPATTTQLVFLVADAPPQVGRQVDVTYVQSIVDAVGRGIKVFPIASSESDDQAEAVFRQLAAATGARFVFLAGGANGAATGANTDIATTDYEELPLDALVVRLISEELAALGGPQPTEPTTTSTTTPGPTTSTTVEGQ